MRTSQWLAIIVLVSMYFLPAQASAQEATPAPTSLERQTLVEMTISPDQMPEELAKLGFDRHTVMPGVVAEFDQADEGIRGRTMYLESGTLVVEPLVPSPVWRNGSPIGSDPELAQPGEKVRLEVGDSMYLPAMREDEFGPDDRIRISNPGTEPAVQIGVHLHENPGTFSPPSGYSYSNGAVAALSAELEQVTAGDTMFRLSRMTADPGAILPFPEGAVTVFYQVDAGELSNAIKGSSDRPQRVPAGMATVANSMALNQEISVTSEEPAQIVELAVFPSALPPAPDNAPPEGTALASPAAVTAPIGGEHPIVGTWVVRPADPSLPFALMQFHTDGTVTNTNPNIGEGIGVWAANDDGTVDANVIFRDTNTEIGQFAPGTLRTTGTLTVDASNDQFEAIVTHTIASETGAVLDTFDLDEVGTRLAFGEIPGWVGTIPPTTPAVSSTLDEEAATVGHPLVGTWVFQRMGSADHPVSLVSFNDDGTAIGRDPGRGTGLGIWAPNADGTVSVLLIFQDIDTEYDQYEAGVSAVAGFLDLADDSHTLRASFTFPLITSDGVVSQLHLTEIQQGVRMSTESTFTWTTLPEPPTNLADAQPLANHPAVGAWIVDANEDPTLPITLIQLHSDGTVVAQNPALGLTLGVWEASPDGSATAHIVWQDIDIAPEASTPGHISGTTVLTLDPDGASGTAVPTFQVTDDAGVVLTSGTYTESITRLAIDSNPAWTEPGA